MFLCLLERGAGRQKSVIALISAEILVGSRRLSHLFSL
jgi:hypothetical protein